MTQTNTVKVIPLYESPPTQPSDSPEDRLPVPAALAFAPIHKRALGAAVGITAGLLVVVLTIVHVTLAPAPAPDLWLLAQYFYGYQVSWLGAFVGFFWAFVAGFVAGWFLAFWRNFILAASVFVLRTRAELMQTRDFLDHI